MVRGMLAPLAVVIVCRARIARSADGARISGCRKVRAAKIVLSVATALRLHRHPRPRVILAVQVDTRLRSGWQTQRSATHAREGFLKQAKVEHFAFSAFQGGTRIKRHRLAANSAEKVATVEVVMVPEQQQQQQPYRALIARLGGILRATSRQRV